MGANKLKKLSRKLLASIVAMLVIIVSMPLTAWADDTYSLEENIYGQWFEYDDSSTLVSINCEQTLIIKGKVEEKQIFWDWYEWPWNIATKDYQCIVEVIITEGGMATFEESDFPFFDKNRYIRLNEISIQCTKTSGEKTIASDNISIVLAHDSNDWQ